MSRLSIACACADIVTIYPNSTKMPLFFYVQSSTQLNFSKAKKKKSNKCSEIEIGS